MSKKLNSFQLFFIFFIMAIIVRMIVVYTLEVETTLPVLLISGLVSWVLGYMTASLIESR
jgi:Flp pilus assembly protein TadB